MASSSSYLPIPPRVWSRVENQCVYTIPGSTYTAAYVPLTGQTITQAEADYNDKLLYKGNILQYKANSARLSKSQFYAQIAKGGGSNRRKSFATQSDTYTNPNNSSLKRINYKVFSFPNQLVGMPNNISGPFQTNIPNPFDCSGNSIQDGGSLVCGTVANPCSGDVIYQTPTSSYICAPSYCSSVPGKPIALCWNNKIQSWFPRYRTIMNNSGTKWPQNYKGFVSALLPAAPVLTINNTTLIASWTETATDCLPISGFNIYVNGLLYTKVGFTTFNYDFSGALSSGSYTIYVTSLSTNIESNPSNSITILL